ncbi:MAG: ABC transporter substrate-binding protein, partial [Actinomycetota bacterium]
MITNVYVDCFNLYYGCLKGSPYKWLDLAELARQELPQNQIQNVRAFMARVKPKLPANTFPNMSQAGDYSGVLHFLKAVKALGVEKAKASGRAVVEQMKSMPTDDDCFGPGS